MRIVFMGTPDFAVPILKRLLKDGNDIVGVFSQPDKPKGRGYTLTPPPVKVCALENNLNVFQPESLKHGEAMPILEELNPEIIVVAAYGQILKEDVLNFPKYGCINAHASLLPKYRGAAPIRRAIVDGEHETGVTVMQMGPGLDSGDMLYSVKTLIDENETGGQLFDRLADLAADAISVTIKNILEGNVTPVPQDESQMTYAKMLSKADSPIDFCKSDFEIHNQIRGLNPWPVATMIKDGNVFKIHESRIVDLPSDATLNPGTLVAKKDKLFVVCGNKKLLELTIVQPFGSKKMPASDYLRGHKV